MNRWTRSFIGGPGLLAIAFSSLAEPPDAKAVTNAIGMSLVPIPAGTFTMGSPATEAGRDGDETTHDAVIRTPFYLGQFEVTQAQYAQVMGNNPSKNVGDDLPVEHISWHDAVAFCKKLSELDPTFDYRLPTETEWEYACRAGTATRYHWGEDPDTTQIADYALYKTNADGKTQAVGQKKPNPWGLYDMSGNVWEWCQDWMAPYEAASVAESKVNATERQKVCRGGCWAYDATRCRSAERNEAPADSVHPNLGMRVVATPKP